VPSDDDSKAKKPVLPGSQLQESAQGLKAPQIARETAVGSFYKNEILLEGYLSSRRLVLNTRDTYKYALQSFNGLVAIPLEEAGKPDFEEWFRRASSQGLAASTIHIYAYRLWKLLEYALLIRGLSKNEARVRSATALEGVPLIDLRKEIELYELWIDKLMTLSELGGIIRKANHPRTKALVPVLYESGCRKGEIIAARVRHVTIGDVYTKIRVFGKTGLRTLPLVRSVPALQNWLEVHPDPKPNAPLFATVIRGKIRRMDDGTPNRLLDDLSNRAGIRHVYPHMLRHTRLTELAAAGVGEYVLKSFAGWKPNSTMAAKYIHFSGRTHIPSILRLEGIAAEDVSPDSPRSITEVYGALGRCLEEAA